MSAFKDHFSGHSVRYHAARPGYPEALFDWLAGLVPDRRCAWDAGCGNGQASVALARRFMRVHATDPSANQIADTEPCANIDYRVERAEQCSLAARSATLATVAQALHWFDARAYFSEVRRVVEPGGVFAAWTYADCRVTPPVDRCKDRVYVDLVGPYWPPERRHVETGYRSIAMPFAPIAAPAFAMRVAWSVDQFLDYLRSWSATQRYLRERGEDPVAGVEADLRAAWGNVERRDVHWDFHVLCGRV